MNARIGTADPARPWVTGLALFGDSFEIMGSSAELMKLADINTRLLDARGRTFQLPPGIRAGDTVRIAFDAAGEFTLQFNSTSQGE